MLNPTRRLTRRPLHAAVAGATGLLGAALASGALAAPTKHARPISLTFSAAIISTTGDPTRAPAPGNQLVEAGIATSKPGGDGATVSHVKITGIDPATGAETYTATFTVYLLKGTQSGTVRGTATPQPDHSVSFRGTGAYTNGTGTFKGIRGRFTFTGTQPGAPGAPDTIRATGTATY